MEGAGRDLYRHLVERQRCRSVEWRPVPVNRSPGQREGSPGVFFWRNHVFVYGGWGLGPMRDLWAAPLASPLDFKEVPLQGAGPVPTYEAKVTVLEEDFCLRVLVTGGWRHGGYYEESATYGIMEIHMEGDRITAQWCKTGGMLPRANHSATYVPPSVAGALYPKGYVLLFGGCVEGASSNSLSLLDLSSFTWNDNLEVEGQGPEPQNSHSTTLLPSSLNASYEILFLGGGSGDDSNGGPPRGGHELGGIFWLSLEPNAWHWAVEAPSPRWSRSPKGHGARGHVAVRLTATDSVVMLGGGKPPVQQVMGVVAGQVHELECTGTPSARAFGGGCALPNGLALIYGGWHPRKGTYSDFWVAAFDDVGRNCAFFQALPEARLAMEPEMEDEDVAFNVVLRRQSGGQCLHDCLLFK